MIYNLSKLINKYYNPLIQAGYKELYLSRFIYLKFNTYNSSPITSSTSEQTLLCSDFFVQKSVPCHIVPPFTAFLKAHRTLFSYAQITKVFHSSFSLSSTQQLTGLPIIPNKKAPPRGAFLILSYDHINFDHVSMTVTHNQPVIHIRIESLSVQNRNNIR